MRNLRCHGRVRNRKRTRSEATGARPLAIRSFVFFLFLTLSIVLAERLSAIRPVCARLSFRNDKILPFGRRRVHRRSILRIHCAEKSRTSPHFFRQLILSQSQSRTCRDQRICCTTERSVVLFD